MRAFVRVHIGKGAALQREIDKLARIAQAVAELNLAHDAGLPNLELAQATPGLWMMSMRRLSRMLS